MKNLKNNNFKFIDLFAGIGGFHKAAKEINKDNKCVLVSEIERYAIETYNQNYNYKGSIENIRDINPVDIPNHDILFAGFPCQAFSNAGKKNGFMDNVRGTLFFDIAKILEKKKPKYAILENVKYLVKHNNGETFDTILKVVKKLGYLTTKEPLILSPQQFGIPQNRERVFIVLVRKDLTKDKCLKFNFSDYHNSKINIKKYLDKNPDNKYYIKDKYLLNCLNAWTEFVKKVKRPNGRTLPVIWADEFKKNYNINKLIPWRKKYVKDMRNIYKENRDFIDKWMKQYNVSSWKKREKKLEWQAGKNIHNFTNSFIQLRQSGIRCRKPIVFPTLVAMVQVPIIYVKNKGWRYLTPRENANIQCFPKKFIINANDHQAYKQFGNSVNVKVVKYVIEQLEKNYGK